MQANRWFTGNTLTRIQNLSGADITTTYTYNDANQLTQAIAAHESSSPATWAYAYDNAGRLTEILPGGTPGQGGRRYTYNTAGLLTRAEGHDGTGYQLQAEMVYNGMGERVQMTGWAEGQSATTIYTIDLAAAKRTPLLADTAGNVTYYLYAKGKPIGERIAGWSYYLNDGLSVPRQMSDAAGIVTLTRTYTPWGEVLKQAGTGNFTWGYFGGLMDAATGLLYVGGGQYYDPATGRFLTPANREDNPYLPNRVDPADTNHPLGAVLGPVALAALFVRRKKKQGKWDQMFVGVILVVSLGVGLSACNPGGGGTMPPPITSTRPPSTPTGTCTPTGTPGATDDPGTPTPNPTDPPPPNPKLVIICGSRGGTMMEREGPECDGTDTPDKDGDIGQMTIWNQGNFPGYEVIHSRYSRYPGYHPYDDPGGPIGDPAADRNIGKSGQALALDGEIGNVPEINVAGYSSGVDAALFYAELRAERKLKTNLILLGPSFPFKAYDTDLILVDEGEFVRRVNKLKERGNNVYVVDDTGTYFGEFGNDEENYFFGSSIITIRMITRIFCKMRVTGLMQRLE